MSKIQSIKNVTRLRVNAGCRLVVATGYYINNDCISINRSPAGYDEHFYVLKNDDVVIREGEGNTFSAVRVVFDKQNQPTYLNIDIGAYYQTTCIRKAMFGQPITSHNQRNTQLVISDPLFENIITHKFTPYGDITADHLYDAPSFIFEHVAEKAYDLRVNEIHFRVEFKDSQFLLATPAPLMVLRHSKLELPDDDNALFVSRSLSRPLRMTFRSHSIELLRELESVIVNRLEELGMGYQLTQIKRGNLLLALPAFTRVIREG